MNSLLSCSGTLDVVVNVLYCGLIGALWSGPYGLVEREVQVIIVVFGRLICGLDGHNDPVTLLRIQQK